jgi:hypothetical protein
MRCEDVQQELARHEVTPALRDAVLSHVEQCAVCQRERAFYAQMDDSLRRETIWIPPPGFAQRVAAQASSPAVFVRALEAGR